MRTFTIFIIGIIATLFVGCTNVEFEELTPITYENGIPSRVNATFNDGEDTRIELNETVETVWSSGDAVSVFYKNTANNKFLYTGNTGAKQATLERQTAYTSNTALDDIVAIYPYSDDYAIDAENISLNIPATQHYHEGSYGLGDNIMSYAGQSDNFNFKSACGWIRLQLTGSKSVKNITFRGNNNEVLNGNATLNYKSLELELASSDNSSTRLLTLDCGEGVQLSAGDITEFYFVIAPQTFSDGFTVEVNFSDDSTITKSTKKSITIERNHIQPMRVISTLLEDLDISTLPLISTYPEIIYEDTTEDIVVIVNANNTSMASYTGDMYAHTGVITDKSSSNSDWKYVKAGWSENTEVCKLLNCGNNIWQFTIKGGPRAFYNVQGEDKINKLAFVFRSASGSVTLKDSGNDIFVSVYERDWEQAMLLSTSPIIFNQDTTEDIIVTLNTSATTIDGWNSWTGDIYAHTGVITNKSTSTSDWKYVKANWNTNISACKLKNVGNNKWQLTIKGGPHAFYGVPQSEIIESLAFVFRSSDGTKEIKDQGKDFLIYTQNDLTRRPLGADYGVTVSGTSATFVLYAPGKSSVHLLADFNNYQTNDESKMKKDGNYFWKTVDGLTIGKEYGYLYLVDGIRVGDPYSEKILDPNNDEYIRNNKDRSLKVHPENAKYDIVSVFEVMPKPYNWSVPNFKRPAKNSLAIYELHLRDFTSEQSVTAAMAKLDYLKTLGINAIELMPIQEFDGNLSWGYDPCFYFAPDKYYGTKDEYKRFIDECHKRGIAVILDVVINHATGQFPYAKMWWDNYNNCTTDANPFFNREARHPYNVFHDFNHEKTETRDYFKRMLKYWLEEYKIDGYRFDLAKGLTQNYTTDVGAWSSYDSSRINIIKDYADAVRSISSDAYIILEHFAEWSEENALANYRDIMLWNNQCEPFYETAMGWQGNDDFSGDLAWGRVSYIESHDEERVAYKAVTWGRDDIKNSWSRLSKQLQGAYCLHFLTPYPKMMWQFGELGYDYSIEYDGRTGNKPVRWDYFNNSDRKALYDALSKAITWRTEHEAMYSGDWNANLPNRYYVNKDSFGGKTLVYCTSKGSVIAVANFSGNYVSFDLTNIPSGTWKNLMTGATLNLGTSYTVSLNGGDYIVLVKD